MMRLGSKDILETALIDSRQPVTITFLSRHADISVADAKKELQLFYESHKKTIELHVVYLISGTVLNTNHSSSENGTQFQSCSTFRCTELVREGNLEAKKSKYKTLDTCEIYCLHTKPLKSLLLLYNIDHLDDDKFIVSDVDRSWLKCPQADVNRAALFQEHGENAHLFEKMAQVSQESGEKSQDSPSPKRKRHSEDEQKFADACLRSRISPQKKSKSPLRDKKAVNQKEDGDRSLVPEGVGHKQRGRKIILKKEESEKENPKASSAAAADNEIAGNRQTFISASERRKKKNPLSQEDIFTNGSSSPDEEATEVDECLMRKTAASTAKKSLSKSISQQNGQPTRKEYVTESYVDEDGFMVTKQVLKEVSVQPSLQGETSSLPAKTLKAPAEDSRSVLKKPRSKKGHGTQSKISAFFKK